MEETERADSETEEKISVEILKYKWTIARNLFAMLLEHYNKRTKMILFLRRKSVQRHRKKISNLTEKNRLTVLELHKLKKQLEKYEEEIEIVEQQEKV